MVSARADKPYRKPQEPYDEQSRFLHRCNGEDSPSINLGRVDLAAQCACASTVQVANAKECKNHQKTLQRYSTVGLDR